MYCNILCESISDSTGCEVSFMLTSQNHPSFCSWFPTSCIYWSSTLMKHACWVKCGTRPCSQRSWQLMDKALWRKLLSSRWALKPQSFAHGVFREARWRAGWELGGFPEACSRQRVQIPPQGVARRKTRVLGQGGAVWPAGPTESLFLSEQSLAGRGGATAFVGFGAEPALERAEDLLPQLLHRRAGSWAAPAGREPRLGAQSSEAGLEAGEARKNSLRAAPDPGRQCKAQPRQRGPGSAETGGGTSEALSLRGAGVGLRTQEVSAGRSLGSPQALLLWALEEGSAQACALGC